MLTKCYSITFAHSSCNKDKIKSWQYQLLAWPSTTATDSHENESDQNSTMRSARFENEAGQIRKRGRPLQKPRGASKWQSTNKKLKISWYVQHRETIQLQIRIAFSWRRTQLVSGAAKSFGCLSSCTSTKSLKQMSPFRISRKRGPPLNIDPASNGP